MESGKFLLTTKYTAKENLKWGRIIIIITIIIIEVWICVICWLFLLPTLTLTKTLSETSHFGKMLGQARGGVGGVHWSKKSMVTSARYIAPFLSFKVFYHTVINYGYFFAYSMTRFLRLANTLSWYVVILLLPRYLRKTQGQ